MISNKFFLEIKRDMSSNFYGRANIDSDGNIVEFTLIEIGKSEFSESYHLSQSQCVEVLDLIKSFKDDSISPNDNVPKSRRKLESNFESEKDEKVDDKDDYDSPTIEIPDDDMEIFEDYVRGPTKIMDINKIKRRKKHLLQDVFTCQYHKGRMSCSNPVRRPETFCYKHRILPRTYSKIRDFNIKQEKEQAKKSLNKQGKRLRD